MIRLIFVVLLLLCGFYAHARFTFSEPRVMGWLTQHTARALQGDSAACDDYTDDVKVELTAKGQRGRWEVEGGKAELCGYLKQSSAALTVLQAHTQTEFDNVRITRGGFPWTTARLQYTQRTSVQAQGLPGMSMVSEDTVVLARTASGLRIRELQSQSSGGL
ncbi:hypothetical protein [Acidovorax sp. LjRoot117]|uniref:hypothetical protein n=1 Tax=Acidovorax sp. LjRoot117 TaxID=3342255 RepID=UPI003ECC3EEF